MKILICFVFVLLTIECFGCGCSKPHKVEDVIGRAAYIFYGTVIDINTINNKTEEGIVLNLSTRYKVKFSLDSIVFGTKANDIEITFREGGTSCDLEKFDLKIGDRYLISAFEYVKPKNQFFYNFCCLRNKIDDD